MGLCIKQIYGIAVSGLKCVLEDMWGELGGFARSDFCMEDSVWMRSDSVEELGVVGVNEQLGANFLGKQGLNFIKKEWHEMVCVYEVRQGIFSYQKSHYGGNPPPTDPNDGKTPIGCCVLYCLSLYPITMMFAFARKPSGTRDVTIARIPSRWLKGEKIE